MEEIKMRINHNLQALNSYNRLSSNQAQGSKSVAKLSSGLRINGAADDAAGLTISEKMRSQIRGLEQASRNAQDGISLIQTAEGALGETHEILQKMRELAVQSANDTNVDVDRVGLQSEADQLAEEITRISASTEFNTKKVLDGSFNGSLHIGANKDQSVTFAIGDMSADALKVGTFKSTEDMSVTKNQPVETATGVNAADFAIADATAYNVSKLGSEVTAAGQDINYVITDGSSNIMGISDDGKTWTFMDSGVTKTDASTLVATDMDANGAQQGVTFDQKIGAGTIAFADNAANLDVTANTITLNFNSNTGLENGTYTVGNTASELRNAGGDLVATSADGQTWTDTNGNDLFTSGVALADAESFTVASAAYGGSDISSSTAANDAIEIINNAINSVSAERAKMGATQNRLEHTINNLGTSAENMTAAESRVRDVDMAKEMMEFTKNNILTQAAQSMLAQANQAPQGVLQLLR